MRKPVFSLVPQIIATQVLGRLQVFWLLHVIQLRSNSLSLSVFLSSGTLLRRLCSLCFDRCFHLSQSVNHSAQFPYCCASLSVFSTISPTSVSEELSMSGDASFQPGSVSCLVFHTSMASDMCPKPYSSFDFSWPSESIQISGLT